LISEFVFSATWFGIEILPTSYVSISTSIVAVIAAVLVPYIGAVSDSTPNRRKYLVWFTNTAAACAIACIIVTAETWYIGGLLSAFSGCFSEWSLTFVYAYLPEMGKTDKERNSISTWSVIYSRLAQVLFIGIVAGKKILSICPCAKVFY
jgi:MFS-type transporter involved in bile tolerance (Atg22 family)